VSTLTTAHTINIFLTDAQYNRGAIYFYVMSKDAAGNSGMMKGTFTSAMTCNGGSITGAGGCPDRYMCIGGVCVFGVDTTAPSTPVLKGTVGTMAVTFLWSASVDPIVSGQPTTGLAWYQIYRLVSAGSQITSFIATLPPYSTSYSTEQAPGTTASYVIVAEDNAGNQSQWSNTVSLTTPPPTGSLSAPTNLIAIWVASPNYPATGGYVLLSWTPPPTITTGFIPDAAFIVYRCIVGTTQTCTPNTIALNAQGYTNSTGSYSNNTVDTQILRGVTYIYAVALYSAGITSASSTPTRVTVPVQ
jgi:hypothetical protein